MSSVEMGNFSQDVLTDFLDTKGKPCTFPDYLKSNGLFPSCCHVYLMTTSADKADKEKSDKDNDVVMQDSMIDNAPKESFEAQMSACSLNSFPTQSLGENERHILCPSGANKTNTTSIAEWLDSHHILIEYQHSSKSLYTDEAVGIACFSRESCFDVATANDFSVLDTMIKDFQPLEEGFVVTGIQKNDKTYLRRVIPEDEYSSSLQLNSVSPIHSTYEFPEAETAIPYKILHHPSEVWGYDNADLIVVVIASSHGNAMYEWYKDGNLFKQGINFCCLAIQEEGVYSVVVKCGECIEASDAVQISVLDFTGRQSVAVNRIEAAHPQERDMTSVPQIDKEDLKISDEISRGSFGVVYKAEWHGTDVAVKHIKVRNAKRLKSVVESEIRVYSLLRHPNIVQLMGVTFLKNSIYIVCEYINGYNLDELLFGEDDKTQKNVTIQSFDKMEIAQQLCKAVAYLHNLRSPVLHRDIKPANVLVTSHVTKICDMGLSKLKSAQSLTRTANRSTISTPSYMPPESLLDRKSATVYSDVWSLACTLVELFTEEDCWKNGDEEQCSLYGLPYDDKVKWLIEIMKKKLPPPTLKLIPTSVNASLKRIERSIPL